MKNQLRFNNNQQLIKMIFHQTAQGKFAICNPEETIQSTLLREGCFEQLSSQIAGLFCSKTSGIIIDVGANMGIFSVPVALSLPQSKIISVEPQRMVFMQLCANLLANKLMNVKPLNFAIGRGEGGSISVPLFDVFNERYTGSVSLDQETQQIRQKIPGVAEPSTYANVYDRVPLKTLDEIVEGQAVSFIKVDVEGMELEVLMSGEHLIRTYSPYLFFECWSLSEFETQRIKLLDYVLGLGYNLVKFQEDYFAYHPRIISQEDILLELGRIGIGFE